MVQRFQPFIGTLEMGNSFSEPNDPDQRERFQMQLAAAEAYDEEAHQMDEDFPEPSEHGRCRQRWARLDVDRLAMLLLDQRSIRDDSLPRCGARRIKPC